MEHYTIEDLHNQFPNEEACLDWLKNRRWPDGIYCPTCCKVTKHYYIKSQKSYSCWKCGHHVHPTADTIFHKSPTPLMKWFYALYRIVETEGAITARQIQHEISVTYKTAWRMRKLLLEQLRQDSNLLPVSFKLGLNRKE